MHQARHAFGLQGARAHWPRTAHRFPLPRNRRITVLASSSVLAERPAAVVFDLGKVLLDFDFTRSAHGLAAACRAADPTPAAVLLELMGHAPAPTGLLARWGGVSLVEQLERGNIDNRQFYELVTEASACACRLPSTSLPAGLRLDYPTFAYLYADIFTPVHSMIAAQQALAAAGVPTYCLSNCSGLHIDDVRQRYPFFSSFTGLVLSYEVRSFKPDPEIYAAAEDITGLSGSDLLFIDDRSENAAAAAARGWKAIHHVSPAGTLAQLRQLDLPL